MLEINNEVIGVICKNILPNNINKIIRVNMVTHYQQYENMYDKSNLDELIYQNLSKLELFHLLLETWFGVISDSAYDDILEIPIDYDYHSVFNFSLSKILNTELEEEIEYIDNDLINLVRNLLYLYIEDINLVDTLITIYNYRSLSEPLCFDIVIADGNLVIQG